MVTSQICSRVLVYFLILETEQIFASFVNVALNETVYQNSYENRTLYDQARAVDGVTHGDWHQCIHTAIYQPYTWLEVDLRNTYFVFEVKIYFRYDYKLRRNGVQVYANTAANASNTGHLCGSVTGSTNEIVNITCNVNARYVTVYQGTDNGGSTALDFVELEVYTCETGYYDSSCDKLCSRRHCQPNSPCPADTGSCTGGCQAGWTGSDCIQACTRYINYGPNCIKLCQNRHCALENPPCDIYRGDCGTSGCQAGWKGADCIQACTSQSTYGPNCTKTCKDRHCASTEAPCDVQYGDCGNGRCQAGWKGTDCTQVCAAGTYGLNCSKSCTERRCEGESDCNHTDGKCKTGCQTRWKGVDCTECDNSYGENCSFDCDVRHCKDDKSPCDSRTGECVGGCKSGWLHITCTQQCPSGKYGDGCSHNCDERRCFGGQKCDSETGQCIDGCIPGWEGISCSEVSSEKETETTKPSSEKTTITALSITTGMLSLFVIIFIVVIIWRLRIRNRSNTSEHTVSFAKTERTQSRAAATSSALYEVPHEDMSLGTRNDDQRTTTDVPQSDYENTSFQADTTQEINDYDKLDTDVAGQRSPYDKIKT